MYQNFNKNEKKVFQCLFKNEEHFRKNDILVSYFNYKRIKIDNNLTLGKFIDSIFSENDLPDLFSPPPGLSEKNSMCTLPIPEDCKECAILEVRNLKSIPSNVSNHRFMRDKMNKDHFFEENYKRVLFKDIPDWFKNFAKEFYELTHVDFQMKIKGKLTSQFKPVEL